MINRLAIENFKSFFNSSIYLKTLNVLSGVNGSGKSSIIQVILLLKYYLEYHAKDYDVLSLNNDLCQLGKVKDVLHEGAEESKIKFYIDVNGSSHGFSFDASSDNLNLDYLVLEDASENYDGILDFFKSTKYIQAGRVGPMVLQEKKDYTVRKLKDIGPTGEYAYSYLNVFGGEDLNIDNRLHLNSVNETLLENTNKWLQDICPGIILKTKEIEGTDLVGLNYSFERESGRSNNYRSTNVGFGISYVLPVIIQCLKAKPGELIIIDTPEAHLHPRGQSKLGELFSKTASDGVQMLIETHSDHVINGIRKSVVNSQISPSEIEFYFFEMIERAGSTSAHTYIHNPKIDVNAKFDFWPEGFFDEWTNSLSDILNAQKNNMDS